MKLVIVALNSKYIHSSLACWYLKYSAQSFCEKVKVKEYTINDNIDWVLSSIFNEKPDCLAFSCYIWNIEYALKAASSLKKVMSNVPIILGGPEVSFDPVEIMLANNFVDYIICGEGEESFGKLIKVLKENKCNTQKSADTLSNNNVFGVCYRNTDNEVIYDGNYCLVENLDSIPSPYTEEMLNSVGNRIVYYEASRGCPFSCSYCISSTFSGVRYFSVERVKSDLLKLINAGITQIKFVDRTFNANKTRAKEIIRFIIESSKDSSIKQNFHFEAAGDLFDDEMLEMQKDAEEGLIQFEIGVQSVNEATLKEINRKTDTKKIFKNVKMLKSFGNTHIHLDLIAGLPYEDYNSFQQSFNAIYLLKPHKLQLGFLKMLKGSKIRKTAQNHNYIYKEYPPYEVLCNQYINFDEMVELKGIEEIFERYYNSGRFINTLNFIINKYFMTPFQFYKEFYIYHLKNGLLYKSIAAKNLYSIFCDYANTIASANELEFINDLLKFDFLSSNNHGKLPFGINRITEPNLREKVANFLRDSGTRNKYFPEMDDFEAKQLLRNINAEIFSYDVLKFAESCSDNFENAVCDNISKCVKNKKKTLVIFDYTKKNSVTGLYRCFELDMKLLV